MTDKIKYMLSLQEELNLLTNGNEYKKGFTQNGDEISWTRCIVMETFSLANQTKWKHWKDLHLNVDWDDIKVEIADIFHFLLSYLQSENSNEDIAKVVEKFVDYTPQLVGSEYKVRDEAEKLIYYTIMIQNNNEIDNSDAYSILLSKFFSICNYSGVSFDELYTLYIAKNCLNRLRQEKGYKEGGYSKVWNGVRDIDVMFKLIEENTSIDIFYKKLLEFYETKA